jgi:hypothetical protein
MKTQRIILLLFLTFILVPPVQAFKAYTWVDERNVVNFTDELKNVPPEHRDRAGILSEEDLRQLIIVHVPGRFLQCCDPEKEIREEASIGDQERLWKERLKEAEINFERAHQEFMRKAAELSQLRFGSRHQYKTKILELDSTNEAMERYEAQIAEAKERLERL